MKIETAKYQDCRWFELEEAPEVCVYMACYGIITEMLEVKADLAHCRISASAHDRRFNRLLGLFCEVASLTWRFDILWPVPDRFRISSFFWRWYNWWEDYLRSLTPLQVQRMERLAGKRAPELGTYRPSGSWLDYRADPAFIVN